MKCRIMWQAVVLTFLLFTMSAAAQTNVSLKMSSLPPKEKLDLYLLIGQSNMAGRGVPEGEDMQPDARVLVFTASRAWQLAAEPITLASSSRPPVTLITVSARMTVTVLCSRR